MMLAVNLRGRETEDVYNIQFNVFFLVTKKKRETNNEMKRPSQINILTKERKYRIETIRNR